jgi:hypothetical protein
VQFEGGTLLTKLTDTTHGPCGGLPGPGQCGPSPRGVGNETAFQKKKLTDTNRTAATSTRETAKPMEIDDDSAAEEREGNQGQEGQAVLTDGAGTDEEDSGNRESPAPSDLARSLREHRPVLQRIRRRLHGRGNVSGITNRFTAMLLWISMQMTRTEAADPSLFLADLGVGEGDDRNKGGRKAKRESLTSFQAPRYRQGPLNLTREGRGQDEEGLGRPRGWGGS